TVEDNIVVAKNITSIAADTTKNILYVNAAAIYGSGSEPTSPSKLYVVNTANKQITPMTFGAEEIEVLSFLKRAILISRNYNNNSNGNGQLLVMNTDNQTVQLFSSSTSITNAYSLNFIPEVPALFVGDADNYVNKGKMNIFNFDIYTGAFSNGFAVNVGVSPKAFAVSHSSKK
ncbi:MAG TPA: hypothetical protein VN040_27305, partial [Pseudosphingobacterium sp.]|nr:hypothetical protein [Pseudosphingobacterium sp.]